MTTEKDIGFAMKEFSTLTKCGLCHDEKTIWNGVARVYCPSCTKPPTPMDLIVEGKRYRAVVDGGQDGSPCLSPDKLIERVCALERENAILRELIAARVSASLPDCNVCGKPQLEPGAILYGPPIDNRPVKSHVCVDCYKRMEPANAPDHRERSDTVGPVVG